MAEDRIKLPCLDQKGIYGKKIYNHRQWLERFKQYRKRKNEIDIGPLIKEEQMTEPTGILKKRRYNKISYGHGDPKYYDLNTEPNWKIFN